MKVVADAGIAGNYFCMIRINRDKKETAPGKRAVLHIYYLF
jgi:hypothetical protein